ncbi:MAG: TonB family protein [Gammaproteobacteria bacterium]|jgi:protein TonB
MMRPEAINWSVAILLSLLVHSILLVGSGARMGEQNAMVSQAPIITRLSFNQSLDDPVPEEPRPIEKQRARPLKKIEAEPVQAKPVEAKPIIRKKKPVKKIEPTRQATTQEQVKGKRVSHSSDELLPKERQLYLHKLMGHIESFKYYPRSARMRSLEGEVKVSFVLLDNGSYRQLNLDGAHSVLVKATRSALESAVPFPAPPKGMILPERLELTMSYSLAH